MVPGPSKCKRSWLRPCGACYPATRTCAAPLHGAAQLSRPKDSALVVMPFDLLPEDLIARVLNFIPLPVLTDAISTLRSTCHATHETLAADSTAWRPLQRRIELQSEASVGSTSSRRSGRLANVSAMNSFISSWRKLLVRAESFHHAVACSGQDARNLSLAQVRRLVAQWGPCLLVNRSSPIYNATVLMEVCRARGIKESMLVNVVDYLINECGASPCANPGVGACTPLIIAASRGMPRLSAFLLACGADPTPQGQGRFRLCGRSASIAGAHSALEWTEVLTRAEAEAGVDVELRQDLLTTQRLLQMVADEPSAVQPCTGTTPSMEPPRQAAERLLQLTLCRTHRGRTRPNDDDRETQAEGNQ